MDDPVGEFKTWFRSLPRFSRTFLAASFIIAAILSLRFMSIYAFTLDIESVVYRLNIWRLFTCLVCMGAFSFNWMFSAYFAYFAMSRVETDVFGRDDYSDFLWLAVYLWLALIGCGILLDLPLISNGFTFALLYIWCKRRPFEIITFFFGIRVKSGYFPFVYMGFNVLLGGSIFIYLLGLGLGHLYIFVKDILKAQHRKDYLATPAWFDRLVRKYITGVPLRAAAPNRAPQPEAAPFFAGRGVQIG